jgi:molybdopterin-containing oxidoreductase family membrane subunit
VAALSAAIGAGFWCYLRQLDYGLGLTGMSRDVSWGLYIGQFTFAVGIAASAVMLVLPYYLHNAKAFGKMVLYGEFVAIGSVTACMLFVLADMGQPARALNVIRYASPGSMMFWDMVSLSGYLVLNTVIATVTLISERRDVPPPAWSRPLIVVSIPWAISIHTVTAFLYCGLAGRPFWHSSILAARFLASAFASGPALLILMLLVLRRAVAIEDEAIRKLATIVGYAMTLSVFFVLLEVFTARYSGVSGLQEHFEWGSMGIGVSGLVLLWRGKTAPGCTAIFGALWIDKGLEFVVRGFGPSVYRPTVPEMAIAGGIWAVGALVATLLLRTAIVSRRYANGCD